MALLILITFINDLLGERRPITEQQYDDETSSPAKWSLGANASALHIA